MCACNYANTNVFIDQIKMCNVQWGMSMHVCNHEQCVNTIWSLIIRNKLVLRNKLSDGTNVNNTNVLAV